VNRPHLAPCNLPSSPFAKTFRIYHDLRRPSSTLLQLSSPSFKMSSRSSNSSDKTPLIVSLENPTVDPISTAMSYQTIRVSCGDEYLDIELRRTLRLPPDDALRSVPAGFGCFPIYLVDQHTSKLPKSVKGGAFIPIYRTFLH
jgi:hypothetical protein